MNDSENYLILLKKYLKYETFEMVSQRSLQATATIHSNVASYLQNGIESKQRE